MKISISIIQLQEFQINFAYANFTKTIKLL